MASIIPFLKALVVDGLPNTSPVVDHVELSCSKYSPSHDVFTPNSELTNRESNPEYDDAGAALEDENDEYEPSHTSSTTLTGSQKKQKQEDLFKSWFAQESQKILEEKEYELELQDENAASLKDMMIRQGSERIIASPRDYQIELFQRAKQQNTIAVLDTGAGKTLIAALLVRHVIDQELEDRILQKPARVSFFLVSPPPPPPHFR